MRLDQQIKRMIEKYTIEASRLSGQEAVEKYSMAYAQAKELGNDFTVRACAANLGAMYVKLGRKEDAERGIVFLKQAIPPKGTVDCASNGDLYFNIALGLEVCRKFIDAGEWYEKALNEYRGERDNLDMEIDTLKRLVQNGIIRNKEEVLAWYKELEDAHGHANQLSDKLMVKIQRITRHKQMAGPQDKEVDAVLEEDVEDCCKMLKTLFEHDKCTEQPASDRVMSTVEMMVKVSVLLAMFKKMEEAYDLLDAALSQFEKQKRARWSLQKAVVLEDEVSHSLQKAVVLQNLGTVCNYLCKYDKAIDYHQQAAAIYQHCASLPPDSNPYISPVAAQRCQGHCLASHAFALVRLDDVDEARVLFDKARDLAVSSGDNESVWHMDEALGAIHFILACYDLDPTVPLTEDTKVRLPESRLEHLKKSLGWYKKALEDLDKTSERSQRTVDRVLDKYTQAKMFEKNASKGPTGFIGVRAPSPQPPSGTVTEDGDEEDKEEDEEEEDSEETEEEEKTSAKSLSEGEVNPAMTKTLRQAPQERDEEEEEEDGDSDDDDEEDDSVASDDDSPTSSSGDDDADQTDVKALYREQLSTGTLPVGGAQKVVKADVHAQNLERSYSSSAESGTSEDDDDEDDDDDDDDDEKDNQKKAYQRRPKPPVPRFSPPTTMKASGTYETPQEAEMHINELYSPPLRSRPRPKVGMSVNYADIDHEVGRPGTSGELERRRPSYNFFISSSDDEGKDETETANEPEPRGSRQDPDYEPINVRQEASSPEPKPDSGKSKTCSIM